jgi:hypothetical protein
MPMPQRSISLMFLSTLCAMLPLATHAVALKSVHLSGNATTPVGERPVQLYLYCQPDKNGTLGLELTLRDADSIKGFDFAPFEGPDAPAAAKALSHLHASTGSDDIDAQLAANGWYSAEITGGFVFGLNQVTGKPGKLSDIVQVLSKPNSRLSWKQQSYVETGIPLDARFNIADATAQHIRETVAACLPK